MFSIRCVKRNEIYCGVRGFFLYIIKGARSLLEGDLYFLFHSRIAFAKVGTEIRLSKSAQSHWLYHFMIPSIPCKIPLPLATTGLIPKGGISFEICVFNPVAEINALKLFKSPVNVVLSCPDLANRTRRFRSRTSLLVFSVGSGIIRIRWSVRIFDSSTGTSEKKWQGRRLNSFPVVDSKIRHHTSPNHLFLRSTHPCFKFASISGESRQTIVHCALKRLVLQIFLNRDATCRYFSIRLAVFVLTTHCFQKKLIRA